MKKKVLLIYPPSPVMNREDRCQQPLKELLVIPPLPPMDLMYLASVARKVDFEPKIVDYSLVKTSGEPLEIYDKFIADLKKFKPNYLVVNVASTTLNSDLIVFEMAKKVLPKIITIAKGAHFLTDNFDILLKHKAIDLLIIGEAEETFKEILEDKKPYAKITGLYYRDKRLPKFSGKRNFIKNLDNIPFPARDLVDNNLFRRPDTGEVQAIIKVSRGCPHHCFFCLATPVSGAKVRLRTPENIIEEITECVEKYKIKNFLFWSDFFNADRDWTMDLCQKLIDSKLNITWSSNTRADSADLEMAKLMYKSGCRLVSIGVESGSQFILDKIGKKITLDQIKSTVKIFKRAKIKTYNYFVLGLPWEDEKTADDTINFAKMLNSDFVSFYTATPLPGTRFYNYAKENGLLEEGDNFSSAYFQPVVKTHCLSKKRVLELHKKAVKNFYLRPTFIFKSLKNIRSFAELKNYIKAGFSVLLRK